MQTMNWRDLQTFLAIARAGQITRAGTILGVDATTIGRRLRRLEHLLGITLFEKTREGQVLTEAGERLLARVETMAHAAAEIDEQAGAAALGPSGTVRISVSEGFGTRFLVDHLPGFARAHPGLTIDLVASSGFLSLSRREADIAIMLSRPRGGPVVAGKLSDYHLRLYAARDYLVQYGMPARPADLAAGHRLVGYIPDLIYAPELRYLDEVHLGLSPQLRSSSIVAQARMIAAGAGIGVLPCFIGDTEPGLCPVLPERRIARSFWVVTHQDTRQLARVRAVRDWLAYTVAAHRPRLLPDTA